MIGRTVSHYRVISHLGTGGMGTVWLAEDTKLHRHVAPFVKDGRPIALDGAMPLLVDTTGRPGPATWEHGKYPAEQDDYPVTGVSWYEAAAYARWAGKSLPTIYHWSRAADP